MTFDQVTLKIQEFMNDQDHPISKVIIDGANKQGVESMRQRSSIPFEYADKVGKVDFIEMLNADLVQAKIKISRHCTSLVNELMGLVWKTEGDKIVVPKKEHPSLPNHLCDAFLYAWRNGYHHYYRQALPKERLTDEVVAQKLLDHHIAILEKARSLKDGHEYGLWNTDNNGVPEWMKWTD